MTSSIDLYLFSCRALSLEFSSGVIDNIPWCSELLGLQLVQCEWPRWFPMIVAWVCFGYWSYHPKVWPPPTSWILSNVHLWLAAPSGPRVFGTVHLRDPFLLGRCNIDSDFFGSHIHSSCWAIGKGLFLNLFRNSMHSLFESHVHNFSLWSGLWSWVSLLNQGGKFSILISLLLVATMRPFPLTRI